MLANSTVLEIFTQVFLSLVCPVLDTKQPPRAALEQFSLHCWFYLFFHAIICTREWFQTHGTSLCYLSSSPLIAAFIITWGGVRWPGNSYLCCKGIEVHLDHYYQMSWLLICSRKNNKFIESVAFNPICVCELLPISTSETRAAPSGGQGHPSSVPVGRSRQRIQRRGSLAGLFKAGQVKYQAVYPTRHTQSWQEGGGFNLPLWHLAVFPAPAWSKVRYSFS